MGDAVRVPARSSGEDLSGNLDGNPAQVGSYLTVTGAFAASLRAGASRWPAFCTVPLFGRVISHGGKTMFILLAIILGLAWIFGFTVYHVASAGIHLLLILAVVSIVVHFVRGRRRMV
jgi:hypothetical protein